MITPFDRITDFSKTPTIKIIGVFLDEFLIFDCHCQKVCKKMKSAMLFISSARNMLSLNALKKLYFAFIQPHILYCLPAFSFLSAKNRKLIFNKQKQCIRITSLYITLILSLCSSRLRFYLLKTLIVDKTFMHYLKHGLATQLSTILTLSLISL